VPWLRFAVRCLLASAACRLCPQSALAPLTGTGYDAAHRQNLESLLGVSTAWHSAPLPSMVPRSIAQRSTAQRGLNPCTPMWRSAAKTWNTPRWQFSMWPGVVFCTISREPLPVGRTLLRSSHMLRLTKHVTPPPRPPAHPHTWLLLTADTT
jgi:hypothetical protein